MKIKYFLLIYLFFKISFLNIFPKSIFDSCEWVEEKKVKNIQLYMQNDKSLIINFYKAQTIVDNLKAEDLFYNLLDFKKYSIIFPKTKIFQIVHNLSENKFIIYSILNFYPLKDRDYYIELEYNVLNYENNLKEYTLEWYPLINSYNNNKSIINSENNESKRIKKVYGRWKIKELINNNVEISVEYHTDFEIIAPNAIRTFIEKNSTITAIINLIDYTLKK